MKSSLQALVGVLAGFGLVAAGCGGVEDGPQGTGPTIVVTTNILGDVVENLVGDEFDVVTIMPVGADPHDFQPSAQQVDQIGRADLLVLNGAGFEEGLLDVIEAAEGDGVPVFEAMSVVESLDAAGESHVDDDHSDSDHDGEDQHGEDEHGHDGTDPHFFTDPARMAEVAAAVTEFLVANVDGVDQAGLRATATGYIDALETVDDDVAAILEAVPPQKRVLVTNHEVFAYFADRYEFEVIGAVIPSGSTAEGASAEALAELAETIEREQVRAIFADTSSSDELAQTLAAEVGDVAVVELFSESLGSDGSGGATYLEMVRTNAQRIADALSG